MDLTKKRNGYTTPGVNGPMQRLNTASVVLIIARVTEYHVEGRLDMGKGNN